MKIIIKTLCFTIIMLTLLVCAITLLGLLPIISFEDEISAFIRKIADY